MGRKSNSGTSHFARVLSERIKRQTEDNTIDLDFGTVLKNGNLLTDSFPEKISKKDYTKIKNGRSHMELREGDRVLVLWVSDEPVVVGIIDE